MGPYVSAVYNCLFQHARQECLLKATSRPLDFKVKPHFWDYNFAHGWR